MIRIGPRGPLPLYQVSIELPILEDYISYSFSKPFDTLQKLGMLQVSGCTGVFLPTFRDNAGHLQRDDSDPPFCYHL